MDLDPDLWKLIWSSKTTCACKIAAKFVRLSWDFFPPLFLALAEPVTVVINAQLQIYQYNMCTFPQAKWHTACSPGKREAVQNWTKQAYAMFKISASRPLWEANIYKPSSQPHPNKEDIRCILDVQVCDSRRRYIQFCTCSEYPSQSTNQLYKILHDPSYLCVIFNTKLPELHGSIPWNTGRGVERSPMCYSSWQLPFHPLGKWSFPLLKILHKQ